MNDAKLNPNQVRLVESTFTHVDELLQRIERLVGTRASAFAPERGDITDVEAALLRSMVLRARDRMLAALDRLGIPRPQAKLSARWSIETSLRFIDISLSELNERTLAGYGKVNPEAAAEVMVLAADLRGVMALGRGLLHPREGEALRDRLAAVPGAVGAFLRAAEQFSREHSIVEARPLIAAAADRATSATVDVGVFGRVSAGKSSLINALIGAPVLPVGATPVTAVPLYVVHGEPGVTARFLDGRTERLALEALVEFATESRNSENQKGVQSLRVASPLVPEGLALLDTPGVGSLSQSGPALAYASLPRCDLGVILVPAGSPLSRDEIALVTGFRDAGIAAEVLLSKSDLLSAEERESSLEYVTRELQRALGGSIPPVHAVAVTGDGRQLFEAWRDRVLQPRIEQRRARADEALRQRLEALLQVMNTGLGGRGSSETHILERQQATLDATKAIGLAADALEASARATLKLAAEAAVSAWRTEGDAADAVRQVLRNNASSALATMRQAADSAAPSPEVSASEGIARMPPLFDPSFLSALPVNSRPTLLDRLAPRARAQGKLATLARPLDDAYGTYAQRIRAWALERLRANVERAAALAAREATALSPNLAPLERMLREMNAEGATPAAPQTGAA